VEQLLSLQQQIDTQTEDLNRQTQELSTAQATAADARAVLARNRRDQESERERVKKAMGDMKRKIERCPVVSS
jgi:hypothetical protein